MQVPPLHPDVAALAGFVGVWRGRGEGHYPTIDPFAYAEELTIGHVGKPFLALQQKTRRVGGAEEPLHAETAYIRPGGQMDGDTPEMRVEMVLSQPSGVVEIYTDGTLSDGTLRLESDQIIVTPTAKSVTEVVREYRVEGDVLSYDLWMAAVGEPLRHHLAARLERAG